MSYSFATSHRKRGMDDHDDHAYGDGNYNDAYVDDGDDEVEDYGTGAFSPPSPSSRVPQEQARSRARPGAGSEGWGAGASAGDGARQSAAPARKSASAAAAAAAGARASRGGGASLSRPPRAGGAAGVGSSANKRSARNADFGDTYRSSNAFDGDLVYDDDERSRHSNAFSAGGGGYYGAGGGGGSSHGGASRGGGGDDAHGGFAFLLEPDIKGFTGLHKLINGIPYDAPDHRGWIAVRKYCAFRLEEGMLKDELEGWQVRRVHNAYLLDWFSMLLVLSDIAIGSKV